ncbi:MAG: sigma-54 dependent transcriptional regulator [Syntrophobacteraceae bacterium]
MNSRNVLIIDDEPVVRDGCRMVLMKEGLTVHVCNSGGSGLEMIREGGYDVIILDLKLPDMDGMEILGTVKKEKPLTSVIIITGYSTVQNAIQAMKLGAFDYLAKPFSDDELILCVGRAIEKKHLNEENVALRKGLTDRFGFANIVGETPKIMDIFGQITRVAPTDCTVLINGENGTGKELVARAIHVASQRAAQQFVAVDCNTLTPTLLESELFGHVKGAFTGALRDKAGIFELASAGTLFLDDVANLNFDIQAKLLRVLEAREYKPVGATHFNKTNARLISATNCDLRVMVKKGTFREDLYYRLSVFPIHIPPLRERKHDIPRLAYHFLRFFCAKVGKRIDGFTEDALEALVNDDWPGNVRQLKNVIERLVIMADRHVVDMLDLSSNLQAREFWNESDVPITRQELMAMKNRIMEQAFGQLEKLFLVKALKESEGNISLAAQRVGMKRSNFSVLVKKHKIPLSSFSSRSA